MPKQFDLPVFGRRQQHVSLESVLHDQPEDEKGGVNMALGGSFQQWWATLMVVEGLKQEGNRAVAMELKEDVALLDSADQPSSVEFCQIKKNEVGPWKIGDLHKAGSKNREGVRTPSVLAKLYRRRHEFSGHPTALRFVSNAGFKIDAGSSNSVLSHTCRLCEVGDDDQVKISQAIESQLSLPSKSVNLDGFILERTNLPLNEQHLFIAGRIDELCGSGDIPFKIPQLTVAARILASEIQDRASQTGYARTFQELKTRILSKSDTLQILSRVAQSQPGVRAILDEAIERLNVEGFPFLALLQIKSQRIRICADYADRTNLQFRNVARELLEQLDSALKQADEAASLTSLLKLVVETARQKQPSLFMGLLEGYINGIALLVLNNGINFDVLTASIGSKSTEKE